MAGAQKAASVGRPVSPTRPEHRRLPDRAVDHHDHRRRRGGVPGEACVSRGVAHPSPDRSLPGCRPRRPKAKRQAFHNSRARIDEMGPASEARGGLPRSSSPRVHQGRISSAKRAWVFCAVLFAFGTVPGFARADMCVLPPALIDHQMIAESRAAFVGSCPCPYTTDPQGRRCGRRSAWARVNTTGPLCFVTDITSEMRATWCRTHQSP